jgi:hypothetical protein
VHPDSRDGAKVRLDMCVQMRKKFALGVLKMCVRQAAVLVPVRGFLCCGGSWVQKLATQIRSPEMSDAVPTPGFFLANKRQINYECILQM